MTKAELIKAIIESGNSEYDMYGLAVYSVGGCEYAIGTDEEATEAAKEAIRQSVWAFNADFLSGYMAGGELSADDITRLRGDRCEDCNDAFLKLIDDFDDFSDDAISADGRAHFLSTYDGEEMEEGDYFIYRIN